MPAATSRGGGILGPAALLFVLLCVAMIRGSSAYQRALPTNRVGRSGGTGRGGPALFASGSSDGYGAGSTTRTGGVRTGAPGPYVRIQRRGRRYEVQTAVTTFRSRGSAVRPPGDRGPDDGATVDLHAQLHLADPAYFGHYNGPSFDSAYDRVLYELLVEDRFLSGPDNGGRRLVPTPDGRNPVAPTPSDRSTASGYGLACQVDAVDYCRERWVHADLTREEFLAVLDGEDGKGRRGEERAASSVVPGGRPLWSLASTSATYPGSDVVSALSGPLTTDSSSRRLGARRLFSHLFLPGDALSGWIRAVLWLGVPCPELSVCLVDWSSLSYAGRGRRRRRRSGIGSGGGGGDEGVAPVSPIAAPVVLSLLSGAWGTARRLVFGQVLVAGQSGRDGSRSVVLIDRRNERALEVLDRAVASSDDERGRRIALLYGAGHCADLHGRLVRDRDMVPVRTEWRTAFSAEPPRWGDVVDMERFRPASATSGETAAAATSYSSLSSSTVESVAAGLVIMPLYLVLGGIDWVTTVGSLGEALSSFSSSGDGLCSGAAVDAAAGAALYLLRHVALYVAAAKVVVDWGGGDAGVFEAEE